MRHLVDQNPAISLGRGEGCLRRQLNVIRRRRVERAFATDPDDSLAVGENGFRGLRRAPRRFRDRGRNVSRNAVDLTGMEQGERAQQRDALHHVLVVIRPGRIAQLQPFEEIPDRAAFAPPDLPAPVLRLPIGRPARIAAAEGQGRHAECQHVDAPIALAGRGIAWHRGATCLVGVPWPAPGRRASLQRSDDTVGDVLVVVARQVVGLAAAVHSSGCGAHRGVLPSWVSGTPLSPRIPAGRGKGAPLARGRRPVPCGGRTAMR